MLKSGTRVFGLRRTGVIVGRHCMRWASAVASESNQSISNAFTDDFTLSPIMAPPDWDRGGRKEKESLTPLYASMKRLIDLNQGCVCLIQVGSFYELYFEQATTYAPKLNLKVAFRKTSNYTIPMAGFPLYQLQKYVKLLVQDLEVNVAIVDQFPSRNKSADNILHRKISRIVSPGTLVDETFLNFTQNNYLLAISFPAKCTSIPADSSTPIGLSWIDLSVGEFYVQQTTLGDLISDVSRINPSEIIVSHEFQSNNLLSGQWYGPLQELRRYFLRYHKTTYTDLKLLFKGSLQVTRKALEEFGVRESTAMNMILSYIQVNLPESNFVLEIPQQYWNEKCLHMDSRTRAALELTERNTAGRASTVGSLLSTIKRTVTPSGSRLLTQWLKSPTLDADEIRYRQSFVALFLQKNLMRSAIRSQLADLGDFVRSVQRLALNTGDTVGHLLSIADGLSKLESLNQYLTDENATISGDDETLKLLLDDFTVPTQITKQILDTLHIDYKEDELEVIASEDHNSEEDLGNESGSYSNSSLEKYHTISSNKPEPSFLFAVKRDFNSDISLCHRELDRYLDEEKQFIDVLRETLVAVDPKLSVSKKEQHGRYTNVLHISGKQKLIDQIYTVFQNDVYDKRKTSLLYRPSKWSQIQSVVEDKTEEIRQLERTILESLKAQVLELAASIRHVSKVVDFIDVTTSFAVLAEEENLVRPKLVKTPQLNIVGGRHMVVESSLKSIGANFVSNDTNIGPSSNVWVVSGPNMGGKSTFLRQNALFVILAQIGSYVPATRASIGIVDKIFTRVGASDDLFSDLSTFMVEMVETSNILKNATPRSLAIVDEIGRGTSGKEGLAIAYATLFNLLRVKKCRTLFATHFGRELESLLNKNQVNQKKLQYYRTRVLKDPNGDKNQSGFVIDHTLEPGISDKSYALEVAQMAGFPKDALEVARKALSSL